MKRVEFSELPKLHAICNRWMHFFCLLLVVILGFWRACKKMSTALSAHYFGSFFLRKIAKFCCDLERFPKLGTIFRKTNSCGPIVREFEPSSYQTQRYAEIWRAFFTFFVLNRFGMFAFWWTDLPSNICPLPNRNTVGREPKNVKKKAMFRRMSHASHRTLCKEKRP